MVKIRQDSCLVEVLKILVDVCSNRSRRQLVSIASLEERLAKSVETCDLTFQSFHSGVIAVVIMSMNWVYKVEHAVETVGL